MITRLGFLVPPGNPTVEPEMAALAPPGTTVHFTRLHATGTTGSLDGQEHRNRQMLDSLDSATDLLAMVRPAVIALAHTATSITLGTAAEAALITRIEATHNLRFITAFGSVLHALKALGIRRIAYGTPYAMATTLRGKAHLEAHGLDVTSFGVLPGVVNIYDETPERADQLGRQVDTPQAEAVFLSGVGMPTVAALARLETDLGKPVISAASAMMWHAMRSAGIRTSISGFGQLFQHQGTTL
jgi:maleate cis-trans isomerase